MDKKFYSVTQLNTIVKNIFIAEEMLRGICVAGEVSGFSIKGGNAYFDLKDENAKIPCCCFGCSKTHIPKDGEAVFVVGSPDFYVKGGRLSLNIYKIEEIGKGLLAVKLEELKARLLEEGYFDANHKKQVPAFCKKIAVITSSNGAVIRDIITTIRKKNNLLDIDVFDVKVQGEGSVSTIISAIDTADKLGYDAIIIARGGGSFEDLISFNDEKLVYSIYKAKTPIISAVGHETDTTLSDLVADVRMPTPTAAAEYIAINIYELVDGIRGSRDYLSDLLNRKHFEALEKLNNLTREMSLLIEGKVTGKLAVCRNSQNDLRKQIETKILQCENKIENILVLIEANNPLKILSQGYFKLSAKSGKLISKVAELSVGDEIGGRGFDGEFKAKITELNQGGH